MSRFFLISCAFILIGCGVGATISAESTTEPSPTVHPIPTTSPTPTPDMETSPISAADADVEFVRAVLSSENTWTFHVTVAHPDTGWDDYADGWDVVLPDGSVVKPDTEVPFTRLLAHPHETEQPFTRAQRNIVIPDSVASVTVRAHDIVDGFGGNEVVVDLNSAEGENFTVER